MLTFHIELPIYGDKYPKRIVDKSYYDHNYYQLYEYGDWVDFGRDNNSILYEEFHELENLYQYTFGHFEGDKFISALGFSTSEKIL